MVLITKASCRGALNIKQYGLSLLGCILVLAVVTGSAVAAQAIEQPAAPIAGPADSNMLEMTQILADHDGISLAEAKRKLETQSKAAGLAERIEQILGDNYAGVWFDQVSGRIKLGVRGVVGRRAARNALATAPERDQTDLVSVDRSLNDLLLTQAAINAELLEQLPAGSFSSGISIPDNAIRLMASDQLSFEKRLKLQAIDVGINELTVEFAPAARVSPDVAACSWPNCDRPLRGGVEIANSSAICSGGWMAVLPSNFNVKYLVTAGHCNVAGGAGGDWFAKAPSWGDRAIGPTVGSYFDSRGDVAKIRVNSSSFWYTTTLVGRTAAWGVDEYLKAARRANPTPNALYCRYGRMTQRSCGYVQLTNTCATLGARDINGNAYDRYVCSLWTGSACAKGGDSGGPASEYGNVATGVASATYSPGGCPLNGPWAPSGSVTYSSNLINLEAQLGVWLIWES